MKGSNSVARVLIGAAVQLGAASFSGAADLPLHPGEPPDRVKEILAAARAGDVIQLDAANYAPLVLRGLAGEPGRAIVVRGPEPKRPAMILTDEPVAMALIDCRHVVLENFGLSGAAEAAMLITGPTGTAAADRPEGSEQDPRGSRDITLRDIIVPRCSSSIADAIRIEGCDGILVERCHLERAGDAAIDLARCSGVVVRETRFVGEIGEGQQAGVRIGAGCRDIAVRRCTVEGGVREGVVIGSPQVAEAAAPSAAPAVPRGVLIEECRFVRCRAAVRFGDMRDAVLRRSTISIPRGALLQIDALSPAPSEPRVRIEGNVFAWDPNEIDRLAILPGHEALPWIALGANIWFSAELPEVLSMLGPFPGVGEAQITTIDPRLNEQGTPGNPLAGGFGVSSLSAR